MRQRVVCDRLTCCAGDNRASCAAPAVRSQGRHCLQTSKARPCQNSSKRTRFCCEKHVAVTVRRLTVHAQVEIDAVGQHSKLLDSRCSYSTQRVAADHCCQTDAFPASRKHALVYVPCPTRCPSSQLPPKRWSRASTQLPLPLPLHRAQYCSSARKQTTCSKQLLPLKAGALLPRPRLRRSRRLQRNNSRRLHLKCIATRCKHCRLFVQFP